eukprot:5182540-Amphidinium_carterae.1
MFSRELQCKNSSKLPEKQADFEVMFEVGVGDLRKGRTWNMMEATAIIERMPLSDAPFSQPSMF